MKTVERAGSWKRYGYPTAYVVKPFVNRYTFSVERYQVFAEHTLPDGSQVFVLSEDYDFDTYDEASEHSEYLARSAAHGCPRSCR